MKKNQTMKWYDRLSQEEQEHIATLAVKGRTEVAQRYKREQTQLAHQRMERMLRDKKESDLKEKKTAAEREKLSRIRVISSVPELEQALLSVDEVPITEKAKDARKRKLIKEQVDVRNKYLQHVRIPSSHKGKQRPLPELIHELSEVITTCTSTASGTETSEAITDPYFLVGRHIMHKFMYAGEETWFSGHVMSYSCSSNVHEVTYDGEDEPCFFDLMEDLDLGDLDLGDLQVVDD